MIDYLIGGLVAIAIWAALRLILKKKPAGNCAGGCAGCSKASGCSAFNLPLSADRKVGEPAADGGEQSVDREFHL